VRSGIVAQNNCIQDGGETMFKRIVSVSVLLLTAFVLTFTLTGCSGQQSAVSGTWHRATPREQILGSLFALGDQIQFLNDGTFDLPGSMSGKYSFPQSDQIQLQTVAGSFTYGFHLSGDTLTFDDKGKTIDYTRVK
jgi:hypothetical protein